MLFHFVTSLLDKADVSHIKELFLVMEVETLIVGQSIIQAVNPSHG
jgi:hypothetical protein